MKNQSDKCGIKVPRILQKTLETLFEGGTAALSLCVLFYSIVWVWTTLTALGSFNEPAVFRTWWLGIDYRVFSVAFLSFSIVQYYCSIGCRCPEWMKLIVSFLTMVLVINIAFNSLIDYSHEIPTSLPGDLIVAFISFLIVSRRVARTQK